MVVNIAHAGSALHAAASWASVRRFAAGDDSVITEAFVLDMGSWAGLYVYPLIAHVLDCVYVAMQHGAPVKHRSAIAAPSTT